MRVGEQYQAALPYRWCFKTLIRLPLVGTFPGGEGFGACVPARCCTQTSDTNYARPARIFAEQKCLAADECRQICCSAERSLDILQTSKALHTRKRVLPKYVGGARLVRHYKSGTPRISKGPRPFWFRKSPEKPFQGFSLGNFFPAARHGASLRSEEAWGRKRTSWQTPASLNWRLRHGR